MTSADGWRKRRDFDFSTPRCHDLAMPPIELRPIGPERLTWPVALVWRAGRRQSAAGKAFLKVALDHAERTEQ
ncbi:MAG: hypothetical protein ACXVVU_23470, partial [Solirubrobacteraceae bacterium]